ncbi:PAS domain S-box protein [Puia sp. P3]|uniref:PAS domain S-box protein n=1 Tax=Puia sp. P3 TaxID=3423952 RepID=UPI003D665F1D
MQTRLELYQLVAPLVGLGIWEYNTGTSEIYVNNIVYQIFEVPPGKISPAELFSFYPDPDRVRQMYHEVVTTGEQRMADLGIATARGNEKWVRLRMRASMDADRQAFSVYGTLEDITSQVSFMRLVQEREQQLSQAFRYAPIGMALVSLTGTWIKVNNSVCQLLGYTEDQLLKITFQDITHPEDLDSDLHQLQQLVSGVIETYSMEKRYFHKDGHIVWALLNVSLVRSDTGEPLYFVSQIKDITELKKSTEIISAQNSRLLNFAHIVSHNLRSHTGNIKMLTDMVVAETDRAEQLKQINMLGTAAANLLETLSELNDVVTIHDNGLEHRESLDLWKEIQRVLTILSPSIRGIRRRLRDRHPRRHGNTVQPRLPRKRLHQSHQQQHQVQTPGPCAQDPDNRLPNRRTDSRQDHRQRDRHRYEPPRPQTVRDVQDLSRQQGREGNGALPGQEPGRSHGRQDLRRQPARTRFQLYPGNNQTIMRQLDIACIIDDDELFTYVLAKQMEVLGFCKSVLVFPNGLEAINRLRQILDTPEALPSVIFLDLNMPVLDGWQFLDEFQPPAAGQKDRHIHRQLPPSTPPTTRRPRPTRKW